MANIITRAGKGAPLSWNEADANFINLNADKVETSILANYSTTVETDTSIAAALAVHIDDAIDAHASSAIGYIPAGTGAVATNVQSKLRESVSVKDFGAVGDGVADDTEAIQAALDAVETTGGGAVFIPAGTYKTTATLNIPSRVSFEGQGQTSIIRPYSCDGINIQSSNVIGPRRIANFWLYASGGDSHSAIKCDLDSTSSGPRAQGLVFEGLYLSFWGTGIYARGLWHTTFRTVTMHNVWTGVYVLGQNVKLLFDDMRITCGGLVSGAGNSIGVHVGPAAAITRPEDVQISNSLIYGFQLGIVWRQCLFGGVTNCDIDACTIEGLRLVTADGGFVFSDNWVVVNNGSSTVYGVNVEALGYTPTNGNISISNNRFWNTTNNGTGYGIFAGMNHTGIEIDNNSITGFPVGLRADRTYRLKVQNNSVSGATISMELVNNASIFLLNNYCPNGYTKTGNTASWDYGEGTWTPTLMRSSSAPTVTYTNQSGYYTRVGNLVTVVCSLGWSANSGGSGFYQIAGLPFTNKNVANNYSAGACYTYNGITLPAGTTQLGVSSVPNQAYAVMAASGSGAAVDVITTVAASGSISFTLTYMVG